MANKDVLLDALTEFMGDSKAAEQLIENAETLGRENKERGVIIRDAGAVVADPVVEDAPVVEEETQEIEEVEDVDTEEVTYEIELDEEILEEIREKILKSIGFEKVLSELKELREKVDALTEDDNDDKPVQKRKIIRPTLRKGNENTGTAATKEPVKETDIDLKDKTGVAARRGAILANLRVESQVKPKKQD